MNRSEIRRHRGLSRRPSTGVTLFLTVAMVFPFPQPARANSTAPDPLVEASMYESRARKEQECDAQNALYWAERAVDTARKSRNSDPTQRDTAAVLVARCQMLVQDIKKRRKVLEEGSRNVQRLIASKKLESAQIKLDMLRAPYCDPKFQSLTDQLRTLKHQADHLVSQGDRLLEVNPNSAVRHYRQAQEIDLEFPNIHSRIKHADQLSRDRRGSSAGRKIAIATTIGVILAGGAYYYYLDEIQRRRRGQ